MGLEVFTEDTAIWAMLSILAGTEEVKVYNPITKQYDYNTTDNNYSTIQNVTEDQITDVIQKSTTIQQVLQPSIATYFCNTAFPVAWRTNTPVTTWYPDTNEINSGNLSLSYNNGTFTNNSTQNLILSVSGYITWQIGATANTSRAVWIQLGTDFAARRYSYQNISADNDYPTNNFSSTFGLAPNQSFFITVWQDDGTKGSSQDIFDEGGLPGGRLVITQL